MLVNINFSCDFLLLIENRILSKYEKVFVKLGFLISENSNASTAFCNSFVFYFYEMSLVLNTEFFISSQTILLFCSSSFVVKYVISTHLVTWLSLLYNLYTLNILVSYRI